MSMADRIAVMHEGRVQQIADPITLYSKPANVFVADFIGSGTLICGIASTTGFEALGSHLPAPAISHHGPAVLLLRPENVTVLDDPATGHLRGTVVETHFYGGTSTTSVAVQGLDAPVIASHAGPPRVRTGSPVGITWQASDAVVIPA